MIFFSTSTDNKKNCVSVQSSMDWKDFEEMAYETSISIHTILKGLDGGLKKQIDEETSQLARNQLADILLEMIDDFKNNKLERIENDGEQPIDG